MDKMFPQAAATFEARQTEPKHSTLPFQQKPARPSTPKRLYLAATSPTLPTPPPKAAPQIPLAMPTPPPAVAPQLTLTLPTPPPAVSPQIQPTLAVQESSLASQTPFTLPAYPGPVLDLEKLLADLAVPRKAPEPSQKTYDWDGGDFVGFLDALVPSPRKIPQAKPANPPVKPPARPANPPLARPAASARHAVAPKPVETRRSVTARVDVERKLQELIKLPIPQLAEPVRRRINMKPPVDTGLRKRL